MAGSWETQSTAECSPLLSAGSIISWLLSSEVKKENPPYNRLKSKFAKSLSRSCAGSPGCVLRDR